ncbi:hypothetical protein A2311_02765 [candidate division WOR-1 bacterium RIFOXYB2_FULL_48_7]|uniref:DUF177 domain-containing protein n=1 Tax=candidate division WOR-1 bacterium RIFOXYB2_FULL_48_7 TaxID=1802583 RepID=A0A1F4TMW5_UNCSA|nr:MAG: hypothetical protein A2311_02765 [candidate division WOR-1 bacterium RIFOXYB2_FULL_48_7]
MKIDLTELLRQIGNEADLELTERVNYQDDGLQVNNPVKIKLHLTNTGTSVLVKGGVKVELGQVCSRCAKDFRLPLTVLIDEEYSKILPETGKRRGKEAEVKAQDFVFPIEADNTIDLGETIRQNLILALPVKPLCQQNCKGV